MEAQVRTRTNILTLRLDAVSQAWFETMRQAHYPAELNRIAAHLTLFHTLPDTREVYEQARIAAARGGFTMQVTGLRSLGRGVAYQVESRELLGLHTDLSGAFAEHLTAQDRQRFMPHVVVQNKAAPERARALLRELQEGFTAFEIKAAGLDLWHYLGGPWSLAESFLFE